MLKNITLSVEAALIEKARRRASGEHKTLNELFRNWIARYVGATDQAGGYRELMKKLKHVRAGRRYSREDLNER